MPEITLPEVKLPDIKLPEGFRDMNKDDIVEVVREVKVPRDIKVPRAIKLPDIDLSKVEIPDSVVDRLPDSLAERMPRRRRTNPILALLALTVVGLVFVAAWWLMTTPTAGTRVRRAMDDLRSRMNGEQNSLMRYDNEADLGSLVGQDTMSTPMSTPMTSDPYATAGTDSGDVPTV
jgi:hypothetical protein